MDTLELVRFAYTPTATFGQLMVDGKTLYTLENPWRNNLPNISCIPQGAYSCAPAHFFRGNYASVEIQNVPSRSHILFHIGNTPDNTEGCILLGSSLGTLYNRWAVLASRHAFQLFMQHYNRPFTLVIQQYKPEWS